MKDCIGCFESKEDEEFGINRRMKDGLQTRCKECMKKEALAYYRNPDKLAKKEGFDSSDYRFRRVYMLWKKEGYPTLLKPALVEGVYMSAMDARMMTPSTTTQFKRFCEANNISYAAFRGIKTGEKHGSSNLYKWMYV